MGLKLSIVVKGDAQVQRRVKRLGNTINDLSDAFDEIGKLAIHYYETKGFTDRGRPWGAPWPPYSAAYHKNLDSRGAKGFSLQGNTMLVRSGKMQRGFYAESSRNGVVIKNEADYYKYHQSSADRTKMPYRPMAGINGNIKTMVKTAIRNDIIRKIDRA